jgi:hypothetical protein
VNEDGGQQHDPGSSPGAGDPAADVVEQGGRNFPSLNWRPRRSAAILLAVGLIIGLAAGYAAGNRQASGNASPPTASHGSASPVPAPTPRMNIDEVVPYDNGPALNQADGTCFAQSGRELQLGVQVTNGSAAEIRLGRIHTVLPLGGLRVISQQWAPCGAIGVPQDPAPLGPGDSTWFSVTLKVLAGCPGPYPVQFTVDYSWAGVAATVRLPGFPDLGQVPYAGCARG